MSSYNVQKGDRFKGELIDIPYGPTLDFVLNRLMGINRNGEQRDTGIFNDASVIDKFEIIGSFGTALKLRGTFRDDLYHNTLNLWPYNIPGPSKGGLISYLWNKFKRRNEPVIDIKVRKEDDTPVPDFLQEQLELMIIGYVTKLGKSLKPFAP